MKVLLILIGLFSAVWAEKKCNTGTDTLTAAACEEATCTSPMFVEYTGMSDQAYSCGACDAAKKDVSCKECTAVDAEDPCNAKVEAPVDKQTFKCFPYKLVVDKWTVEATAGDCQAKKDTAVKCNSPGKEADKTYVQLNSGCGPCNEADKTANKCTECTKTSCNSAATLAFVLVPLLAVIFHAL